MHLSAPRWVRLFPAVAVALVASAAAPSLSRPPAAASGGTATVSDASRHAFGRAVANLRRSQWPLVRSGKELFVRRWAEPPLGPLHNAGSCSDCHFLDGRGEPSGTIPVLLRLSIPGPDGMPLPEPRYGVQLQDRAVGGARAEGTVILDWQEVRGRYPDGARYTLRRPRWRVDRLAQGPLHPGTRLSPRIPPSLVGLGLLEAVAVADLPAGRRPPGRFGWKGAATSVQDQVQRAMAEDLGLTELDGDEPRRLTTYVRLLAVPARRGVDRPEVRRGETLFRRAGCAGCHLPELRTAPEASFPELAGQTIRPYTDLLLHDLGSDLADIRLNGRPDRAPSSRLWRTAPLWGLGLQKTVTGTVALLHDGRARSAEEAILWHGGEARTARSRFRSLPAVDRGALLRFLDSL